MPAARLILEDGTAYHGQSFGSTANSIGEVVFNTSLTGYQEIATDPSYRFQIVVMTYPHIGNYGIEPIVEQSGRPQVAGFVVRDAIEVPSSAHSQMSLYEYFNQHGISAIQGLDTRAPTMSGLDLVKHVTAPKPYDFDERPHEKRRRIAVYDYGVKRDILRKLTQHGNEVCVYPATTPAEEILRSGFDGVVL